MVPLNAAGGDRGPTDREDRARDGGGARAVRVRDVRSVWGPPVEVPLGRHVTVLVGPNRSGTSNVAWAVAAALDPGVTFVPRRDVPRPRRGRATPEVEVRSRDGRDGVVRWDASDGSRTVDGHVPSGRVVLAPVETSPRDLARAAGVTSDPELRTLLAHELTAVAGVVLPGEVRATVDAAGEVVLRDELGSSVPDPEVRAIAAIALARAVARAGHPAAGLVLEAPEVFLHPAGQQSVADLLLDVGRRTGTPVVVTTTSPFAVPRVADATVVALARDGGGRTDVVAAARGDAAQAPLLGGLLRDPGLAAVLDRTATLPATTRGVLIVEGGTDEAYLRQAADALDRTDLLVDVAVRPAGGAMAAAAAAIVLREESEVPVVVLLDHDDPGRRAVDTLVSRFGFDRHREVVTYADVYEGGPIGVEAETLFDQALLRRFVAERGPATSHGELRLPQGLPHVDLTSSGKSAFVGWSRTHARPEHLERWAALLDLLDDRFPRAGQ